MMISPESYVEDHKDDTFEQLIEERERLIEEIRDLEDILLGGKPIAEEYMTKPGPDVIYQMDLEYLAALCTFMSGKYNKDFIMGDAPDDEDE